MMSVMARRYDADMDEATAPILAAAAAAQHAPPAPAILRDSGCVEQECKGAPAAETPAAETPAAQPPASSVSSANDGGGDGDDGDVHTRSVDRKSVV